MANAFGLKPGNVVRASASTLSQNNIQSWIWGAGAFLGFSKANPDRNDVSCGKTFVWAGGKGPGAGDAGSGMPGPPGTIDGYGVLEWLDAHLSKKTYMQSADWYYGLKVTAQETGIPILGAVNLSNFPMVTVPGAIEG
jgi:hypothetical protein